MTIPARREAASTLLSLDPPDWFLRHACAVGDVAGWLALRLREQGYAIDVRAVDAAALLHDVDKLPSVDTGGLRHGDGSAAWLAAMGWTELAAIVRDHPVTRLADDDDAARLGAAPLEARVVAYADKRAGQRLVPMAVRFGSWRRRYPDGPTDPPADDGPRSRRGKRAWSTEVALRVYERAEALEREVCAAAGVRPGEVRRLYWTRRALREAAR